MTEFLDVDGGRIAYEVTGQGPLVVLAHGMGDNRTTFRFLVPVLAEAGGTRVASTDLRGHGESSTGWPSYTRTRARPATARADQAPGRPRGHRRTLLRRRRGHHRRRAGPRTGPRHRGDQPVHPVAEISFGAFLTNRRYRRGGLRLVGVALTGSVGMWKSYLNIAFPGRKPADYDTAIAALLANMREPGRMAAARAMGRSQPVRRRRRARRRPGKCPALVFEGTLHSDWPDTKAEGDTIVAAMPAGLGQLVMVSGAGHYAHAQFPDQVASALLPFLKEHAVPRAGLTTGEVVAAAAGLADEIGSCGGADGPARRPARRPLPIAVQARRRPG